MGLEAGQAQPELGVNWGRSKAPAPPRHLPAPREPAPGGAPGWEGSCSSLQPPAEASSCTGSPRASRKITAHGCAPAPQPRGGGGEGRGAHPSSRGSPGQDADEHPLHPLREGRGAGFPPNRLPAPLQTGKAPSGEGKSSALPEARETPLSQGSSWTVRFKELFHSGKRKARVKRKSAGQRRGIPAPGARHSAP